SLLFSESNTRFLIEVAAENVEAVSGQFGGGLVTVLGEVTESRSFTVNSRAGTILAEDIDVLRSTWKTPLDW
nr:hypothetical protein [Planctomycetota bacterium]